MVTDLRVRILPGATPKAVEGNLGVAAEYDGDHPTIYGLCSTPPGAFVLGIRWKDDRVSGTAVWNAGREDYPAYFPSH
jgi:hypothetical protein